MKKVSVFHGEQMLRVLLHVVTTALFFTLPVFGNGASSSGGIELMPSLMAASAPQAGSQAQSLSRKDQGQVTEGEFDRVFNRATGDLDELMKARLIRILTVYGLGRYYLDGAVAKGLVHEVGLELEKFINQRSGSESLPVHVIIIPVARNELIPSLLKGRGDIAIAGLTITPDRARQIDFTDPAARPISEVLVTGPSAPELQDINDLAGREIFIRFSSSYYQSLLKLNERFKGEGKSPVLLSPVPETLEDEDILEMVNTGLLDWSVVDDYKAKNWSGVFTGLTVREDIVLRKEGLVAFAVRKESPLLLAELNEFLKSYRQGSLHGNILINRWYRDFNWATNALSSEDYSRFEQLSSIFKTYGEKYGMDFMMVAAQGYQESRLDRNARSHVGAIGIMQLLPSTASDPNVGIPDISTNEANIHAGVKYLDFIRKRYFNDPDIDPVDQTLFALASYNAGPAKVRKLRDRASQLGYDPNRWFDNVELIAAQVIGQETVRYVANIVKYYTAYRLSFRQIEQRAEEREKIGIE